MSIATFFVFHFVQIVLVESIVMWRLKWGTYRHSLVDALMMNFASILGLLLGLAPLIRGAGPFGLMLFCTYSLMVEIVTLMLLERHPWKKVVSTVLIANLCSCVLLAGESFMNWADFSGLFR
jgi:hypothetical protein